MKNIAGKIIIPLIALLPWTIRNRFYTLPGFSPLLRKVLNYLLPRGDRPQPVTVTAGPLKGLRMAIRFQDEKFFWLGTHEPPVQKALLELVGEGTTAYDVGAYIGFFTLLMASRAGRRGRVVALEPNPLSYDRLRRNIRLNQLSNVRCLNLAAADSSSRGLFLLEEDGTPLEGHLIEREGADGGGPTIEVETAALDDLVVKRGFPRPDLVKIDVEGSEKAVLAGMKTILEEFRPAVICEVHSRAAAREAAEELRRRDYRITDLERGGFSPENAGDGPARRYLLAKPLGSDRPTRAG